MEIFDYLQDCPNNPVSAGDVFRHHNSYVMIVKTAMGVSLVDLKDGDQTWGTYPDVRSLLSDFSGLRDARVEAELNVKGLA
ncbi:hypothetical protein [Lactiplantibacillus paraxiangfangensis]|uniref:hypothetical protein n=1 Tax=Lactiplantibacillus paraxiangfangensis TaxID=3076224 RepID=UPI0030C76769